MNCIAFVTYRCTSRCRTCRIWKKVEDNTSDITNNELQPGGWAEVVGKLSRTGVRSIEIFGGDALLRKDITYSIVERCTELDMDSFFPTNGNLLSDETALRLVSLGLGTIYFSVDGIEQLQDHIRGVGGTYSRLRQAILSVHQAKQLLETRSPRIGVITTVSNMNVESIDQIVSEMERLPVDFVHLQGLGEVQEQDIQESSSRGQIRPTPLFVSTAGESHLLSKEQAIILNETLTRLRRREKSNSFGLNLSHLESLDTESLTTGVFPEYPCHLCTTVVTLTPSGHVVPCPMFSDYILGSVVGEDSLSTIWGNQIHQNFLLKQRQGDFPVCRKCSMRHFYPGIRERFRQVYRLRGHS